MRNIPTRALSLWGAASLLVAAGPMPVEAFDCAKAKSAVEKAICADTKLKAADDAMSAAYAGLREALTGADRKTLGVSQRKWVKGREDRCGYLEGADLGACILGRTEERRMLLAAEPESGPGTGSRLMPVFVQQDPDPYRFDVDYTLIRFVAPRSRGETLFNAEVAKMVKQAPLKKQLEAVPEGMTYASYAAMALTYASPKFISARIEIWENTGGAHGNGGTSAINIDLGRGAALKAGDLFDDKAIRALTTDCVGQIAAQKKEKNDGQEFNPADDPIYQEETVIGHLRSLDTWSFWQDKATVTFNAYAIGSYAEGPYSCDFAMGDLRTLAKSGTLLPE